MNSMDAMSKDGSKVDIAKETWTKRLAKATITTRSEHIVYNKIGVWLNMIYSNVFKMSYFFCFNLACCFNSSTLTLLEVDAHPPIIATPSGVKLTCK